MVVETSTADVLVNNDGIPEQVNEYRITELLGEGAFAKVFKAEKTIHDQLHYYAIKVFHKSLLKRKREFKRVAGKTIVSNAFQKVQKEVAIMKKIRHQHLTKLFEVIDSPQDDKLFLVLEYVAGGQVMEWNEAECIYENERTGGPIEEDFAKKCTADMILGIEYLHANSICHRDIKPENILVGSDAQYKLADFGVAHMLENQDTQLRNTEGTYHFLAPECLSGEAYDPYGVDIWSLGITIYAMLFGHLPFDGFAQGGFNDVIEAIRTKPVEFPNQISPDAQDILQKILEKDPTKRISISQLKAHPWVQLQQRLRGKSYPPAEPVQVTPEEIELAFTPINNLILMTKLKIKMRGKLSKARRSLNALMLGKKEAIIHVESNSANPAVLVPTISTTTKVTKKRIRTPSLLHPPTPASPEKKGKGCLIC